MPYDAVRSQTHRKGRRDLLCLTGSPVRKAEALRIGAKASNQASRLPSERPRIFPNLSGKVPLWRGKINIPGSEDWCEEKVTHVPAITAVPGRVNFSAVLVWVPGAACCLSRFHVPLTVGYEKDSMQRPEPGPGLLKN